MRLIFSCELSFLPKLHYFNTLQYHELDYDSVISKIDLDSHTQLEELFINANAAGFITGKMDQEKRRLYVSTCGKAYKSFEIQTGTSYSSAYNNIKTQSAEMHSRQSFHI